MEIVGALESSRVDYSFVVRNNKIHIIGGLEEYKKSYITKVETITADGDKGTPVTTSWNDCPSLNVGRIQPSCILLNNRYLYVFFGKTKKGRSDIYQNDIEYIDLEKPTKNESFLQIKLNVPYFDQLWFNNSLILQVPHQPEELLIIGGMPQSKKH